MPTPQRVLAPWVLAVVCLALGGCDDDCDHPIAPTGETTFDPYFIETQAELEQLRGIEVLANTLHINAACDTCRIDDLSPLAELRRVENLVITATDVHDLQGLENLEIVERELQISGNDSLATIDALASLDHVGLLKVSRNPTLASLAPLRGLSVLEFVFISEMDAIETLDVFDDLDDLQRLDVRTCDRLQTLPRVALPNLRQLALYDLPALPSIELGDGSLPSLAEVSLRILPGIDAAASLVDLTALEQLDLDDLAGLTELPGLAGAQELDRVWLARLPLVTDLSALAGSSPELLSLTELDGIEDLQGLASLPRLELLQVDGCDTLTSLSGLASVPQLAEIRLSACPQLVDGGDPTGFAGLGRLWITNCGLVDLTGFSGLESCETLTLRDCTMVTSLDGLGSFTGLKRLELTTLPALETLGEVVALPHLEELQVWACSGLADLQGLGALPSLSLLGVGACDGLLGLGGPVYPPVMGRITIRDNAMLASLDGLAGVESVEFLTIVGNGALGDQAAFAFAQGIEITGLVQIGGNHP